MLDLIILIVIIAVIFKIRQNIKRKREREESCYYVENYKPPEEPRVDENRMIEQYMPVAQKIVSQFGEEGYPDIITFSLKGVQFDYQGKGSKLLAYMEGTTDGYGYNRGFAWYHGPEIIDIYGSSWYWIYCGINKLTGNIYNALGYSEERPTDKQDEVYYFLGSMQMFKVINRRP